MINDYGKICVSSKNGKILYGKNGSILWKDCEIFRPKEPIPRIPIRVILRWYDANVTVVTTSFWRNLYDSYGSEVVVGYNWHGSSGQETYPIWKDGYGAYWTPYESRSSRKDCGILCSNDVVNDTYEIHLRQWQNAQSLVTVIVTDNNDIFGTSKSAKTFTDFIKPTSVPNFDRGSVEDVGFKVVIKYNGEFDRIELIG